MNLAVPTRAGLTLAAIAAAAACLAGPMSAADQAAAKKQIASEFREDRAACAKYTKNDRDVCDEKAEGREKIALAELQYNLSGSVRDAEKLAVAKADAAYEVADELCDDKTGSEAKVCERDARSAHARALADAKSKR